MSQSSENSGDIFTGRLQLVAVKTRSGERDRLSLEFDFDEASTGEDVLAALLPQIADSYYLENPSRSDLSNRSGGNDGRGRSLSPSGSEVPTDAYEVRLRDTPDLPPFPLTRPLLEHPKILELFLQRRTSTAAQNPRKVPTFVLQPKVRQATTSATTAPSAEDRVPERSADAAKGADREIAKKPTIVSSELTGTAVPTSHAVPVEAQKPSHLPPLEKTAADTSLGVVLLDSAQTTREVARAEAPDERQRATESQAAGEEEEASATGASRSSALQSAPSTSALPSTSISFRATVEGSIEAQQTSVESMLRAWLGPPSERAQILSQLPIEPEYLAQADELLDEFNFELKDMRIALRERIHWVHLIRRTPQRGDWLEAMEAEVAASRSYAALLAAKREDERQALRVAQLRLLEVRQRNEALQIEGIRAREAIKRRDALQAKLDGLRADAEELRNLEVQLQERMRKKLLELYAISPQRAGAEHGAASNREESPAQRQLHQQPVTKEPSPDASESKPMPCRQLIADDGNTCFDDDGLTFFGGGRDVETRASRSTVDYQFLSPNLRDSVKRVLETSLVADASSSATVPPQTSQRDDLRALAAQLSQYLNGGSPDPSARLKLLTEVRRVRDAVERHRSSPRAATERSVDVSPLRHQYDVRSLPDGAPASSGSLAARWASPLAERTATKPFSGERGDVSSSSSAMEAASAAMAELAVPFFRRF